MGKKKRLKQEKKERQIEEAIKKPVEAQLKAFFESRGVDVMKGYRVSYLILMIVNFMTYRSIKAGIQLPSVRPKEEEHDENRLEGLYTDLALECRDLGVSQQEVMSEVVNPLAGNEVLMQKVLEKNYDILESFIPTDNFRKMTDDQIENTDSWGDSLSNYEERKEEYFEAIKEIFGFNLSIVRADMDGELKEMDPVKGLAQIQEKYGFESDDFEKLRRRSTEFLRVAFANYLEMDFQAIRLDVDARAHGMKGEDEVPIH